MHRKSIKIIFATALIVGYVALSIATGRNAFASAQPPSRGQQQDSLQSALVDYDADVMQNQGDGITRLIGNVHFHHNGAIIQCDSAFKYTDERMEFFGRVIIEKDSALIYGDRVLYNGETNLADVFAPIVKMVRGGAVMYSYNLQFDTETSIAYFHGGGVMSQGQNLMEAERGYFDANRDYIRLLDSVALRNEQFVIKTDSLGFHMNEQRVDFLTLTYIWDSDRDFLRAGGGNYFSSTSTYLFTSDAYIMTPENELWANTIRYLAEKKQAYLFNDVQILDTVNSTVAFGDWGFFDDSVDMAILTQKASIRVWQKDTTSTTPDSSYMRADTIMLITLPPDTTNNSIMENIEARDFAQSIENSATPTYLDTSYTAVVVDTLAAAVVVDTQITEPIKRDSIIIDSVDVDSVDVDSVAIDSVGVEEIIPPKNRIIKAYTAVKLWNSSYQARCDSMVAYTTDSSSTMFGTPILWSQNNQITSQRIDLYTKNQELDWADFTGEPFIAQKIFPRDTLYFNQAEGRRLEAYFRDNELDYTVLSGNVKNIYYMNEDGELSAFVAIESAELKMVFEQRTPTKMIWKGTGSGPIYPINAIPPTQSLFLEGFIWQDSLRPKSAYQISPQIEKKSQRQEYSRLLQPIFNIENTMEMNKAQFIQEHRWRDRTEWPDVTGEYFLQRNDQLLF